MLKSVRESSESHDTQPSIDEQSACHLGRTTTDAQTVCRGEVGLAEGADVLLFGLVVAGDEAVRDGEGRLDAVRPVQHKPALARHTLPVFSLLAVGGLKCWR